MSATDAKIDTKPEVAASEEAKAVEETKPETKEETPAVAPSVCNRLRNYKHIYLLKPLNI